MTQKGDNPMTQKQEYLLHEQVLPGAATATQLIAVGGTPYEDLMNALASDHEIATMDRFKALIQLAVQHQSDAAAAYPAPIEASLILIATSLVPAATVTNTAYSTVDDALDALIGNEYTHHILDRKTLQPVTAHYSGVDSEGMTLQKCLLKGDYKVPKKFKQNRILFSSDEDLDEVGAQTKLYVLLTTYVGGIDANERIMLSGFHDIWYNVQTKKLVHLTD
jgi:hypothetical protein